MSELQRCKNALREKQMADAFVNDARQWADFLVKSEFRGPGDTVDAAMDRAARKHGIARSVLWSLRYRPPRDLFVSAYMRLRDLYEAELARLDQRLEQELRRAEQLGLDATNSKAYRAAAAALGKPEARA